MTARNPHPMRRTIREERRVWPVALALVVLYLVIAEWRDHTPDAMTDAPPSLGAWHIEEYGR